MERQIYKSQIKNLKKKIKKKDKQKNKQQTMIKVKNHMKKNEILKMKHNSHPKYKMSILF